MSDKSSPPLVVLEHVTRIFPGTVPVKAIVDATTDIPVGSFTTIRGASGSGKSTLLHIIGMLDTPTAGRVWFQDEDVSKLTDSQRSALRASSIAFVFQAFHLLNRLTAIENVAMGALYAGRRRSARMQDAEAALVRVGLSHRVSAFPATMSGGERQRVAIARGIMSQPQLLLCDEPTGNLDTVTSSAVLELLSRLNADGLTIVMITHDANVAAVTERRMLMRDGTLLDFRDAKV